MLPSAVAVLACLLLWLNGGCVTGLPPATKQCSGAGQCSLRNAYGRFPSDEECNFSEVVYPTNEEEILAAVARASERGMKVKAVSRDVHTIPKWVCPGGEAGMLISTERHNSRIDIDVKQSIAIVDSGVYLRALLDAAAARQLAVRSSPYWEGLSIGGIIAMGSHGSSLAGDASSLSDSVLSMRLVVPLSRSDGGPGAWAGVVEASNGDLLAAAKINLGVLGVVSQITLQLMPLFKRAVWIRLLDDTNLEDVMSSPSVAQVNTDAQWYPSVGKVLWRSDQVISAGNAGDSRYDPPFFRPTPDALVNAERIKMETWEVKRDVASQCAHSTAALDSFLDPDSMLFTKTVTSPTDYRAVGFQHLIQAAGSCDAADDREHPTSSIPQLNPLPFGVPERYRLLCPWDPRTRAAWFETSIAVPFANLTGLISAIRKLVAVRPNSTCVSVRDGLSFRFVSASSALLGPPVDSAILDIQSFRSHDPSDPRLNQDILEEIEQMALGRFGGRPHWARNRPLAFDGVASKYPSLGRFLAVRRQLDPRGLFSNEWSERVLADVAAPGSGSSGGAGCAMEGACVCAVDEHCSPARYVSCQPGIVATEARVCRPFWPCNETREEDVKATRLEYASQWLEMSGMLGSYSDSRQLGAQLDNYVDEGATWDLEGFYVARNLSGIFQLALTGSIVHNGGLFHYKSRTLVENTVRWSRDAALGLGRLSFASLDVIEVVRPSQRNITEVTNTTLTFDECDPKGHILYVNSTAADALLSVFRAIEPLDVCQVMLLACPGELFPYNDMRACNHHLSTIPVTCNNGYRGRGGTLVCQAYHAIGARIDPFHFCTLVGPNSNVCVAAECPEGMRSETHSQMHNHNRNQGVWKGHDVTSPLDSIAYALVLLPGLTFAICWLLAVVLERRVKAVFMVFRGSRFHQDRVFRLDSQTAGSTPVCTILFSNLSYYTKPPAASLVRNVSASMGERSKENEPVRVLNKVWGRVGPGKLIAIMVPSGAGKTTLLKLLGSRPGVQGTFSGTLMHYDRTPTSPLPPSWLEDHVGCVQQESTNVELHPQLTVRESLVYRALLKLPKDMTLTDKMKRVEAVISEMGLRACAEIKLKNVSGGQKRRTHVAMHLLVLPSLLILDEPTSGLDANTALELVKTLYILSRSNRTVILTIHQPRARILCLADRLAIMQTGGEMIYWGPPQILFDALADTNRPRTSLWSKARIILGPNVPDATCREIVSVFRALDTDRSGMVTRDKIEWWIRALQIRADAILPQDPSSLSVEVLRAMGWMHGVGHITFFQFVNFVHDTGALGFVRKSLTNPTHRPSASYTELMLRADTLTRPFRKKTALQASGGERAGKQFTVELLRGVREWMNRKAHRWVKRIYDFEEEEEGSMVNPGDTIIDTLRKPTNDLLLIPAITRMRESVLKEAADAVKMLAESKENKEPGEASSPTTSGAATAGGGDVYVSSPGYKERPEDVQPPPLAQLKPRLNIRKSMLQCSSQAVQLSVHVYNFWMKMVVRIGRFARAKGVLHIHSMVISSFISAFLLWSIFGYVRTDSMWNFSKFGMLLMIFLITSANIAFFQVTLVWVPEAKAQYEMEQADGVAHAAEFSTLILLWDAYLSLVCALTSCVFLFLSTNLVASAGRLFLALAVFALFSGCMQGIGTLLCIVLGQTTATVSYGAIIAANLMFTGFVVKLDNQPVWWKSWIHASYIAPSYHAMNAILQLRFRDQPMDCKPQDLPATCYDGDSALQFFGYYDTPLSASVLMLILLFITLRVVVHVILAMHGEKRKTTLKHVDEEEVGSQKTATTEPRPDPDAFSAQLARHHTF